MFNSDDFNEVKFDDLKSDTFKICDKFGLDYSEVPDFNEDRREYSYYLRNETSETIQSVVRYTGSEYISINRGLSGVEKLSNETKASIKNIDLFLSKTDGLKQNSIFYRLELSLYHKNWKIGDTVTTKIFSSTSIDKMFVEGSVQSKSDVLKFYARKGSKCGAYISPISLYNEDENEFLMKRNLKFKIISNEIVENKKIWNLLILDD